MCSEAQGLAFVAALEPRHLSERRRTTLSDLSAYLASGSEDLLAYLKYKPVREFAGGRVIYSPEHPPEGLYLVMAGRVKLSSHSGDGRGVVSRVVCQEGLFGEASLIGAQARWETAVTLDPVTLMSWTRAEIEHQMDYEPRLGVVMVQHLVRQCLELQDRMQNMAAHKIPERVMLALIQLAVSAGTASSGGWRRLASLTHQTIAEYVGTSREIVTLELNHLRKDGLIRYSRRHMDINVNGLQSAMRSASRGCAMSAGGD
jgi:CRP/FNR family transcriptional regulator